VIRPETARRYDRAVHRQLVTAAAGLLVATGTIVVLVGLAVGLFLNPAWVSFEQGRADVSAWTGWSDGQVGQVTGALLHDLVLGPPAFDVALAGQPVFDERERAHLRDVRAVFIALGGLGLGGLVVLVAGALVGRGAPWFWRSVAAGATLLALVVVVLGVFATVAFETAFELFHRSLFAGGSYTFDPARERLVQLFPEQFWYETALLVGVVLVAGSLVLALIARRRLRAGSPGGGR